MNSLKIENIVEAKLAKTSLEIPVTIDPEATGGVCIAGYLTEETVILLVKYGYISFSKNNENDIDSDVRLFHTLGCYIKFKDKELYPLMGCIDLSKNPHYFITVVNS